MKPIYFSLTIISSLIIWGLGLLISTSNNSLIGNTLIHLACLGYLTGFYFWIKSKRLKQKEDPNVTFWKKSDTDYYGGFKRLIKLSINIYIILLTPIIILSNWLPYKQAPSKGTSENFKSKTAININFNQTSLINSNEDENRIKTIIHDFFDWYILATNNKINSIYQPSFIEDKNGSTTLDLNSYTEKLRSCHFSEDLIQKEIRFYKPCIDNLKNVEYSDFLSWTELDQFEESQCDFSNQYRWTGGQEPIPAHKISDIESIDSNHYQVLINTSLNELDNSRKMIVIMVKQSDNWYINNINGI